MAYCANCGETLRAPWKFCGRCGTPVDGARGDAPSQENGGTSDQCMATTKSGSPCRRRAAPGHVVCSTHLGSEATVTATQRTGNGSDDVTAPLPVAGPSVPIGPPPGFPAEAPAPYAVAPSRDRSTIKVAALAAATAVVLLALALGIANNVGTRRRLDDTREDLASTDRSLATTRSELAARTAERDDLQNKLSAAEKELGGAKQSLTDTRSKVDAQAGQIEVLKTCLNGVLTSLEVAGTTGDTEEAFRILDSVEGACERSSELL